MSTREKGRVHYNMRNTRRGESLKNETLNLVHPIKTLSNRELSEKMQKKKKKGLVSSVWKEQSNRLGFGLLKH